MTDILKDQKLYEQCYYWSQDGVKCFLVRYERENESETNQGHLYIDNLLIDKIRGNMQKFREKKNPKLIYIWDFLKISRLNTNKC